VTKPSIAVVIPANGERLIDILPVAPYKTLTTGSVIEFVLEEGVAI
jgi:hypothetical protein